MIAILKREWKSYFQNITGWLFIAAVLALYGLYFLAYNLRAGYPYVSYTLSAISFIMLIAVPILTMRSMAEERQFKKSRIPQAASFSAMAFPIPWEAPVINIVFIKTSLLKK